ncbi:phenolic acid decarboxylase subunit B [Virgibacillus dokdonensis]|uniref:Flavin prenyltransferase UbiX n=1 Tax=Virgibacillus dokdonensis TaxID=302167 RepID=A0A3E0WJ09_9BACI|nr:UbiX family flavin prenyltransferase [Virgibacillus dokdonensis]RFA32970.1 phenolic acid decarboxylase subunit B [Virgibacillus dokdonensis]
MRIVVGISGASGAIFGIKILESLHELGVETYLIISDWAKATINLETNYSLKEVESLATVVHSKNNLAASVSSGSFRVDGMIIAPCSMKTLASIRVGFSDNLISRTADVMLKEHKKLILLTRETPLNTIHLENMLALSQMGVVILPPTPAFYNNPSCIDDVVNHIVARTLDQLDIENDLTKRWESKLKTINF